MIDYRNALDCVRNPFLQYDKKEDESDDDAMVRVYNQRLKILHDARRDLELAIRELVIIKGVDQETKFHGIWEWYASTITAVQMHFQDKKRGGYVGTQTDADREWRKKQHDIMYSTSNEDLIMGPFNKRMKEIEAYVASLK
jgi:predicted transcriptional regulator